MMNKITLDHEVERLIAEKVRTIIREENAALLSALAGSINQGLSSYLQTHTPLVETKMAETERNKTEQNEKEPPSFADFAKTKGVQRKTIETAKMVAQCLHEQGPLRLSQLVEEVKKKGGDLGANPSIKMKTIMEIYPAIQKTGHGIYTYQP